MPLPALPAGKPGPALNKHYIWQHAEQPLHGIAPPAKDRRGIIIKFLLFMKQNIAPKKLQLTKIKVANLSIPREKGKVCMTSIDATTCPTCKVSLTCL